MLYLLSQKKKENEVKLEVGIEDINTVIKMLLNND